jgi:hypothetical protein
VAREEAKQTQNQDDSEIDYDKVNDFHFKPKASKQCVVSSSEATPTLDHPPTIPSLSYWESKEARILFTMKVNGTILQSIDNQIEILKGANIIENSYLGVLSTNGERDDISQI